MNITQLSEFQSKNSDNCYITAIFVWMPKINEYSIYVASMTDGATGRQVGNLVS